MCNAEDRSTPAMNLAYRRTELTEAPLVSVVMPCLNEELAIGACIEKIQRTFETANIDGEIIVCDNGSTDSSVAIAESHGRTSGPTAPSGLRQRISQGV